MNLNEKIMTSQIEFLRDEILHTEDLIQEYTHPNMGYDEQFIVDNMKETLRELYKELESLNG